MRQTAAAGVRLCLCSLCSLTLMRCCSFTFLNLLIAMMMNPSTAAFSTICHLDREEGRLALRKECHREAPLTPPPPVAIALELVAIEAEQGGDEWKVRGECSACLRGDGGHSAHGVSRVE